MPVLFIDFPFIRKYFGGFTNYVYSKAPKSGLSPENIRSTSVPLSIKSEDYLRCKKLISGNVPPVCLLVVNSVKSVFKKSEVLQITKPVFGKPG